MKLVVDMNLSPVWLPVLQAAGHEALHWSTTGDPRAEDSEIMAWARQNGYVVFTPTRNGSWQSFSNGRC
ncbi:MAG: DUF5615 family PIN-like protein [Deltaproteobacteria bacterium]|nr:DUF5615 family PIN-like protein [Deltaproteobacteria bacterium]